MRLPRDISGDELARLLRRRYGYRFVRQRGSHMRLTSTMRGADGHVSVPRHRNVKVTVLNSIISQVGEYLGMSRDELLEDLFR